MNEALISKDEPKNRLLVEGSDDLNVCYHLLNCYNIKRDQVEVVNKEGIENLLQSLEVELMASGPRRLGILVDADENLVTRWQSLLTILATSGYHTVPTHPTPEGTIIKEDSQPVVGIWLMPNNQLPGMLEHFCSFMVPPGDVLWQTADNTIQEVLKQDRRFPEHHQIKAHIHTWLAWQKEPGKPMGQAITKRFLDHKSSQAQQFMSWIRRLFVINQI